MINFSNQWVRFTLIPIALVVPHGPLIQAYLIGGIILFISGAWDDAKEIGHFPKFASRIIAAGVVVFHGDLWIAQAPYAGVDEVSPLFGKPFAFLAIYLTQVCHPALSNALPLLLLGLPIVDILAVLFLRIKQKMNWFKATRNHVHHRLLDRGFNHYESVIIIYSIQAVLVISAIFMQYHGDWWVTGWYLLVCVSVFIFLVVAERANWTAHRVDEESKISQLIVYLKTKDVLTVAPARLVMFMVPLFIAVTPLWITTVPRDFGMVSGAMLMVLAFEMFFGKNGDSVTARAAISVVAIFAAYLSVNYVPSIYEGFEFGRTVYFTVLAIAIATSVRFSKRISFNVTPTDYLIVFGLLTTAFFANEHFVARDTSVLLIQAVILLYGCQLLIDQKGGRWSFLNVATLGALGVLAVRGLRL